MSPHQTSTRFSEYVARQLRGTEAQYRGSVITLVTMDGEYVYASGQAFANGIDAGSKIGRSFHDYLHPEDVPRVERAMQEALVCELPVQIRVRVRTKDGYGVIDRLSRRLICEQTGQIYILSIATKVM